MVERNTQSIDFMMNDDRRRRLTEQPDTVLQDGEGRTISFVVEQAGSLHLVFARIDQAGQKAQEKAAIGVSLEAAVRGIGQRIFHIFQASEHIRPNEESTV